MRIVPPSRKLGRSVGCPLPPGALVVIVYLALWRLCTMMLNNIAVPMGQGEALRDALRGPFRAMVATNILFIIYLVADAAAFPWAERDNRAATICAYVLGLVVLALVQYVLWRLV